MIGRLFSSTVGRLVARGSVAAVMTAGLVVSAGPAAQAADPDLVCSGGGSVTITKATDGTYDWLLSGVGSCTQARVAQVRQVSLLGRATTTGLGFCSGSGVIPDFNMAVAATFVRVDPLLGPVSTLQAQFWRIPATTFPVVSPFQVTDASGLALGAGELETHIFAKCPPDGQPTMQVNWVQAA